MGLAERFKNRLEKRDIFSENTQTSPISSPKSEQKYEYEDIEAQIIDKIKRTPYWSEYPKQKQENMIKSYIDKKAMGNPIPKIQRKELVDNIMILSGNS